jgi:hypothetical protein
MKNKILLFTALSISTLSLSAQFGLDKIKTKVEKSTNTNTNESSKATSTTEKGILVSDDQKAIEKELDVYNSYVQGSRTHDMMMGLKKENKTADHFVELVTKYNSYSSKNETSLRHIARAEEFYTKMETKELPETEKDVNRIFTKANALEYNGFPLEMNSTKQESWKVFPKYVIDDLNKILPDLNDQKIYLYKDKSKIDALISKCETEIKRLDAYMKSDYTKFKAEYDKARLNSIVLGKPGMNDPALCAFVKTKFDTKYGKVIKAVIVDELWTIKKTTAGIPTYKVITYNASVKAPDGSCKKHVATIAMQYEGGGKYGEKYLTYNDPGEMSCDNVNK